MKITRIKTFKFSVPTGQHRPDRHTGALLASSSKPWLFVKVETDAGMNNLLIQEMNDVWFRNFDRYVEHDWRVQDGSINVSDRPGLGVEVKEADIARLPYEPLPFREYRHHDGSWKGW